MKKREPYIFVVDDDPIYLNFVKQYLKKYNYNNVETYTTGEACIAALYRDPDIILLDYVLKAEDGIDVLRKIKDEKPDVQVVLISGQNKVDVAIEALRDGAFDYVVKDETTFQRLGLLIKRVWGYMIRNRENKFFRRKKLLVTVMITAVIITTAWLSFYGYLL